MTGYAGQTHPNPTNPIAENGNVVITDHTAAAANIIGDSGNCYYLMTALLLFLQPGYYLMPVRVFYLTVTQPTMMTPWWPDLADPNPFLRFRRLQTKTLTVVLMTLLLKDQLRTQWPPRLPTALMTLKLLIAITHGKGRTRLITHWLLFNDPVGCRHSTTGDFFWWYWTLLTVLVSLIVDCYYTVTLLLTPGADLAYIETSGGGPRFPGERIVIWFILLNVWPCWPVRWFTCGGRLLTTDFPGLFIVIVGGRRYIYIPPCWLLLFPLLITLPQLFPVGDYRWVILLIVMTPLLTWRCSRRLLYLIVYWHLNPRLILRAIDFSPIGYLGHYWWLHIVGAFYCSEPNYPFTHYGDWCVELPTIPHPHLCCRQYPSNWLDPWTLLTRQYGWFAGWAVTPVFDLVAWRWKALRTLLLLSFLPCLPIVFPDFPTGSRIQLPPALRLVRALRLTCLNYWLLLV